MKRLISALVLCVAAVLGVVAPAAAQGSGKVMRIVVGFPPGQAIDMVARLLAEELRKETGDTVIVENRPGQGGSIALGQFARAQPDGNTLFLSAVASLAITPHLYKNVAYDSLKSFEAVALIGDVPLLLVAHPSVPAQTLPELVAYARANPDKLNHPSSGNGTISHLAMEELKRAAGMRILHVPYQGSAPAMNDLVAGTVSVALDTIAATQGQVRAGKLRLLASGSARRLPMFPDTPTIAEQGYEGFEASAWLGMLYPAGTPRETTARMGALLNKIVRAPDMAEKFAALGLLPRAAGPDEFAAYLKREYERWGRAVAASGLKPD